MSGTASAPVSRSRCAAALADILAARNDPAAFAQLVAALGLSRAKPRTIRAFLDALDENRRAVLEAAWPLASLASQPPFPIPQTEDDYLVALLGGEGCRALRLLSGDGVSSPSLSWRERATQAEIVREFDVVRYDSTGQGSFYRSTAATAAQLHRFVNFCRETPLRLLDRNHRNAAMLDWLIALKEDAAVGSAARAWVEGEYDRCDVALARLRPVMTSPGRCIAYRLVAARRPPAAWLDDSERGWLLMLPFVAGVVALVQRLAARAPALCDTVSLGEPYWDKHARVLAPLAPALYQYDLCLFDLLLSAD